MSYNDFEAVIGLEIHAQLLTKSKLFCKCSTAFGSGDNEQTCPVCTGQPGALPVPNEEVLNFSIKTGLALNCSIREKSVFARKNYFYPDLPKGYQISQYDEALCESGHVDFYVGNEKKRVQIVRAHIEEDAGKSIHQGDHTFLNYNRSSVPLLEIVSGPDMRSSAEAAEYAKAVRQILLYTEVCDGNLEEGSMRCDCNVSVRKKGVLALGTKVELKNINSFRFIEKAIQFEIERQVDCIESGETIFQETRLYDPDKNRTVAMRSKEEAHDYRYFPDPDLLPVIVSTDLVNSIRSKMPELPLHRAERFQNDYGLPKYDSLVLTQTRATAEFFEEVVKKCGNAKAASNWIMVELSAHLNEIRKSILASPISAPALAELIQLIDKGTISGRIAKEVFSEMCQSSRSPEEIVKAKGLVQITDAAQLASVIDEILAKNSKSVDEYRAGKDKLFGFFVGLVMKQTRGQASPEIVNQLLGEKLKKQ